MRRFIVFSRFLIKFFRKKKHVTTNATCFFLTGDYLVFQAVSNPVPSAYEGLTTVFGMGTGGTPQPSSPDHEVNSLREVDMLPQNCTRRAEEKIKSRPRPISTRQLKRLLALHTGPINPVIFRGSYSFKTMRGLISRLVSRLDAFSVYPFRT